MLKSKTIIYKDFSSDWFEEWSKLLKQQDGLVPGQKIHNKAWQNAIIMEALKSKGVLKPGNKAIGFGVGIERVPSLLASLDLKVTATDQDFESGKKAGWDNGQLAHSGHDLNMYGICSPEKFKKNLTYKNADMNKLSPAFKGRYDIVWSNCALGHLGTIDNGIRFIEKSLKCLKPGGVAVHTTEVNISAGTETIETGGTVIFRLSDLAELFYRLRQQGYVCSPLVLDLGKDPEDMEVSFYPYNKNNLLKIQVGRHILSQIVLIIRKPKTKLLSPPSSLMRATEKFQNSRRLQAYYSRNNKLREYLRNQETVVLSGPKPIKKTSKLKIQAGYSSSIRVKFKNTGSHTFYDMAHVYHSNYPLIVVTDGELNRLSKLATKEWASKNRPSLYMSTDESNNWGAIEPGRTFWADLNFKAPKKPGIYIEQFCLALEGQGVIENSSFTVEVVVS